ncbi:hypothetical protein E4U55_006821 [Claviceps digitariae]|nr:hypothetical protein E4U55_006821 [Claviceps digitariae]
MPPFVGLLRLTPRDSNTSVAPEQFSSQWTNPSDVFSVLLILGGDVIGRALAQVAGTGLTFLPFSFGWVAYSVSTVVSAVGENRLMPVADFPCKVINGKTGHVRDNASWIIGRIVRDFAYWANRGPGRNTRGKEAEAEAGAGAAAAAGVTDEGDAIQKRLHELLDQKWKQLREATEKGDPEPPRPTQAGLCVSVYEAGAASKTPRLYGPLAWIGIATAAVQLGIAAAPWARYGDWSVFLVTAAGTLLALITTRLPQWTKEKWSCRHGVNKTVVLTKGNGSQHAIVIISHGRGLDLEDLASGSLGDADLPSRWTRASTCILAVAWIMLLVAAAGIKEHTWFLLGVGGLGMAENLFEAGMRRLPESYGIPLLFREVIAQTSVMHTLYEVEDKYPRLGWSMLPTFFPGMLREDEMKRWDEYEKRFAKK